MGKSSFLDTKKEILGNIWGLCMQSSIQEESYNSGGGTVKKKKSIKQVVGSLKLLQVVKIYWELFLKSMPFQRKIQEGK